MSTISDINTLTRSLTETTGDTDSLSAANLLIYINEAYERVVGWLIVNDGRWQFDDNNYTDLPEDTGTLVEATRLVTVNANYLAIEQVLVLDVDGEWRVIPPVDKTDYTDIPIEEYYGTTGFPEVYDKLSEDTFELFPAPTSTAVTLASGFKVKYKRTADVFTTAQVTTGTKVPGFASPWHNILAYMAADIYCSLYKPERVAYLRAKTDEMKKEMLKHYSKRDKDDRAIMTNKPISYL